MQYIGEAGAVFHDPGTNPAMGGAPAFEMSFAVEGSTVIQWTDLGFAADVRRYVSTDSAVTEWTQSPTAKLFNARFPFVVSEKIGGYYYAVGQYLWPAMDLYMWKSADGITWELINAGTPVLSKSSNPASIWYNIWNVAVARDGNGVWHLVAEAAPNGTAQAGTGLAYSSASMSGDNINFDANRGTTHVVQYGGNPYLQYLPERNALLAVHGMIYDPQAVIPDTTNYWYLTASTVSLSTDVSQSSNWATHRDKFSVGQPGVHVADPSMVSLPTGKTYASMMAFSYAQTQMYMVYSGTSLIGMYDILTNQSAVPLEIGVVNFPHGIAFDTTQNGAFRIKSGNIVFNVDMADAGQVRVNTTVGIKSLI